MPNKPSIKLLASQTAVYGLSSVLGRTLNYLLVPLYTAIFAPEVFGVYAEIYAYLAILLVILTYGMETAFFHFAQKIEDKKLVFSTAFISILATTSVFILLVFLLDASLAKLINYPQHSNYIRWLSLIVGLDILAALPLARLRLQNKAKTFAAINILNVVINILLNLFFLVYCKNLYEQPESTYPDWLSWVYNPSIGVGYIFVANLIASAFKAICCTPFLRGIKIQIDTALLKKMLRYALPLLIAGLGFIINERLDVILLKYFLPGQEQAVMRQVGIYSACYKLAILMTLFIQAFRYAAEPFFFSNMHNKNNRKLQARVLNYFVIFCSCIFLAITFYLDIFKYFLRDETYWEGLKIVPILLMANLFLGIYINLSLWYRLSGQTYFGAIFSLVGATITIILNIVLIPVMGYMASAWTTFIAYFAMMLLSYVFCQKHYPIPYNYRKIILYIALSGILYWVSTILPIESVPAKLLVNTLLFIPFFWVVYQLEAPIRQFIIKNINKYGNNKNSDSQ